MVEKSAGKVEFFHLLPLFFHLLPEALDKPFSASEFAKYFYIKCEPFFRTVYEVIFYLFFPPFPPFAEIFYFHKRWTCFLVRLVFFGERLSEGRENRLASEESGISALTLVVREITRLHRDKLASALNIEIGVGYVLLLLLVKISAFLLVEFYVCHFSFLLFRFFMPQRLYIYLMPHGVKYKIRGFFILTWSARTDTPGKDKEKLSKN